MRLNAERTLRAMVSLSAALVLMGPMIGPPAWAQPPEDGCPGRSSRGRWTSISVPMFERGQREITDLAVDVADERLLLVTNGSAVIRSDDGGCSWAASFALGDLPAPDRPYTDAMADIAFIGPLGGGTALMVVAQTVPASRPRVLLTTDAGLTWSERAVGLEAVRGRPLGLAVGAQNIYLLIDPTQRVGEVATIAPPHSLYVSSDGGLTWEPRAAEPEGTVVQIGPIGPLTIGGEDQSGTLDEVAVSPLSPDELWLYGSAGLYRSTNEGLTATPKEANLGPVGDFDIATFTSGLEMYTVFAAGSDAARRSLSGASFARIDAPARVASSAFPAVSGPDGIFIERFTPSDLSGEEEVAERLRDPRWRKITPRGGFELTGLQSMGTLTTPIVFGHTETTIERYEDNPRGLGVVGNYEVGDLPGLDLRRGAPSLDGPERITLSPGRSHRAVYELAIPPRARKVDVFFAVDDSRSMIPAIEGVKMGMEQIIRDLTAAGLNVWFGVGRYCAPGNPPTYERLLEVSPPGPELSAALNRMETNCGGSETQLGAAYEATTGDGLFAAPDQQAGFRRDAIRIILNITDESISQGAGHPTYEQFATSLNAHDVKHIGLAIQNEVSVQAATVGDCCPAPGLRRAGEMTGTVAPAQGADCNGDSLPDLAPGEPLVCVVSHALAESGAVMSTAIVNTVKAVAKKAQVELDARSSPAVARRIAPGSPLGVDLFQPNLVRFDITYRCPPFDSSRRVPVEVIARRGSAPIARMTTAVFCEARPDPPPNVFLLPIPLPPLQPPRVPETVPNANPQPQPNPQPQAQAQVGFATQEQRQPQLAWVGVNNQPAAQLAPARLSDRYAFSTYRGREEGPQHLVLSAAFLACLAAAFAVRTRPQHASNRRR